MAAMSVRNVVVLREHADPAGPEPAQSRSLGDGE
jgi:hypothetical protein